MENTKIKLRWRRRQRIRAKIVGTPARPRLAVFRSNRAVYVQIIDDEKQRTIVSRLVKNKTRKAARALGQEVAQIAKKKGITTVVFDRGGYKYHGAVAEIAEGVREGGVRV